MIQDREIRALVGVDDSSIDLKPSEESPQPDRWRRIGIGASVAVVLACLAVVGALLLSEARRDPGLADVGALNVPVVREPVDLRSADDPFKELRYLPASAEPGLTLTTSVAQSDAIPIVRYTRTNEEGVLTGAIFIDESLQVLDTGLAGDAFDAVMVGSRDAQIGMVGPLGHLIAVSQDADAHVLSWAVGITPADHIEILESALERLEGASTPVPSDWRAVSAAGDAERGIWRAYYSGLGAEIAIIESSHRISSNGCAAADSNPCRSSRSLVDDDGVSVWIFGSVDRTERLLAAARQTTAGNARVSRSEIAPYATVELSQAESLLFAPRRTDGWRLHQVSAFSSGRPVTQPALVLYERKIPELGDVTSAVVVHISPDQTPSPNFDRAAGAVLPIEGATASIQSWRHTQLELIVLRELFSFGDDGFVYARRAVPAAGLDRSYEPAIINEFPETLTEGVVYTALISDENDTEFRLRVSRSPGFHPEASAVMPHVNDDITIPVRGQIAAFIVTDQGQTLTWEERPGIVIQIEAPPDADVVSLASSLEAVSAAEVIELTS